MGFYTDALTDLQVIIRARLQGGTVSRYVIDGRDVSMDPLESLFKIEESLSAKARFEDGSKSQIQLVSLKPFR